MVSVPLLPAVLVALLHLFLPCASCQGCSRLLVAPGICAGAFDPSVPTPRTLRALTCHPCSGWLQGPSCWPVWAGGSWRGTSAGTGSVPPCHLPGCCPHQCQCFHPLSIHPPPDAMCAETSQPTPISHLLGRMWRIPSLGCVWRGAAVTAPEGSVEGGD